MDEIQGGREVLARVGWSRVGSSDVVVTSSLSVVVLSQPKLLSFSISHERHPGNFKTASAFFGNEPSPKSHL